MIPWTAVNPELTTSEPAMASDNARYLAFVRRVVRGYARRVAEGDTDDLRELISLREEVDAVILRAVRELRDHAGLSWFQVARALGVTRQAAQQRYGSPGEGGPSDPPSGEPRP